MLMKKTFRFVFAAASMLAAASCAKDYVESMPEAVSKADFVTFSVSVNDDATKTSLSEGKTVWAAGDSILFSDGSKSEKVAIPAEFAGMAYAEVDVDVTKINASDTIYAVYPPAAFKSAKAGVVNLSVLNDQSGNFDEANICVAMAKDYHFAMSNAASIMKFTVPEGIETVVLAASAADTLAGNLAVSCLGETSDSPAIQASSPVKSIKVVTGGLDGTYYVAVIPGTYKEFSMTALTLEGKVQKKKAENKSLPLNAIVDLGLIGDDLSGNSMEGSGSEEDPFLVGDLADITTLATVVSNGLSYEGQYFKIISDITDVVLPVGTADSPFHGLVDGQNHTITINMGGPESTESNLGLFGALGNGASVKNVKVAGSVSSTGGTVAGLAASASKATIEDCQSSVTVKVSGNVAGGLLGNADNTTILNCQNSGSVTGKDNVAGIVASGSYCTVNNNVNSATITSLATACTGVYKNSTEQHSTSLSSSYQYGTGGIAGWINNSSVNDCVNNGSVNGFFKVAGICGSTYWTPVTDCVNNGKVEATGSGQDNAGSQNGFCFGSCVGGIVGWLYTQGHVTNCKNTGEIVGRGGQGGIVGLAAAGNNVSSFPNITGCENTGAIKSNNVYHGGGNATYAYFNAGTGGIVGIVAGSRTKATPVTVVYPSVINCTNKGDVSSSGKSVGGIVGLARSGNKTNAKCGYISGCVNEGSVTGTYWVGGLIGTAVAQYAGYTQVVNCENHGTVTGNNQNESLGAGIGGLVGVCAYSPYASWLTTQNHLALFNSYNDGDVLYTSNIEKPYAGGVIGNVGVKIDVQNCYNSGNVGPADSSSPAEGAEKYLGGVAGYQSASYIKFCYYSDSCVPSTEAEEPVVITAVGTQGAGAAATVVSYDAEQILESPVTANNISCTTLLQVLNEWQNYYVSQKLFSNWASGTNGPVLTQTLD